MTRPGSHGTLRKLVCLVALCLSAMPLTYACGDDTSRPSGSGDDSTSSSGGADSSYHDVAVDTHHAGDGTTGEGAQGDDGSGDDASENDVSIDVPVFEANPPKDEGVGNEKVIPLDGPQTVGDDGGD
jgi:hypothetical protein